MKEREDFDLPEDMRQFLVGGAFDDDGDEAFTSQVVREVRLMRSARTIRFWAPFLAGAAATGLAILALVQVLAAPDRDPEPLKGQEAMRTAPSELPDLSEPALIR
ncbi:MAG: hypothetical protein KF884_06670 [Fimbriimonadaceae bacterium]|nr:hypothetical protein [Fimbriimonadaceae bacterium]QYK57233.1 MAG: hypothetical protein KF884_06670 [Fimbriimonadaceae bacterium]